MSWGHTTDIRQFGLIFIILLVFDLYCFNTPLAFIQLWIFAIKINIKSGKHTQTTEIWNFLVYSPLPPVLVSAPNNHQPPTSQMAGFYGFRSGSVLKLNHRIFPKHAWDDYTQDGKKSSLTYAFVLNDINLRLNVEWRLVLYIIVT